MGGKNVQYSSVLCRGPEAGTTNQCCSISDTHTQTYLGRGREQPLPRQRLEARDDGDDSPPEGVHVLFHDDSLEVVVLFLQLAQRVCLVIK